MSTTSPTIYEQISAINSWIDTVTPERYASNSLAMDWGRIAKVSEECGEAVSAFIGLTGQNPRKGVVGTLDDVIAELADVAITAICAIQHFTEDHKETRSIIENKCQTIVSRAGIVVALDPA